MVYLTITYSYNIITILCPWMLKYRVVLWEYPMLIVMAVIWCLFPVNMTQKKCLKKILGMREKKIKGNSLVWVEYWPAELERTLGKTTRLLNRMDSYDKKFGITSMFDTVGRIAAKHGVEVAVSDPANCPMFEINRLLIRGVLFGIAAGVIYDPVFITDLPGKISTRFLIGDLIFSLSYFLNHIGWRKEWGCVVRIVLTTNSFIH